MLITIYTLLFPVCSHENATSVNTNKLKTGIHTIEDAYAARKKAKNAVVVLAHYSKTAFYYPQDLFAQVIFNKPEKRNRLSGPSAILLFA